MAQPPRHQRRVGSEEQSDKIFELLHAQRPIMRAKGKEIHKSHQELHNLVLSDNFTEAQAKELTATTAKLGAELMLMMATTHNQIYQLLTPEQRKKLAERQSRLTKGAAD